MPESLILEQSGKIPKVIRRLHGISALVHPEIEFSEEPTKVISRFLRRPLLRIKADPQDYMTGSRLAVCWFHLITWICAGRIKDWSEIEFRVRGMAVALAWMSQIDFDGKLRDAMISELDWKQTNRSASNHDGQDWHLSTLYLIKNPPTQSPPLWSQIVRTDLLLSAEEFGVMDEQEVSETMKIAWARWAEFGAVEDSP